MPLPEPLVGDRWTQVVARAALPILVNYAKQGKTITYGELDQEIINHRVWGHVHIANYGGVGGAIGSALIKTSQETGKRIPPINAIIVNANTGLPGNGVNYFIQRYTNNYADIDQLDEEELVSIINETQEDVFTFKDWDKILTDYGFEPVEDESPDDKNKQNKNTNTKRGEWSNEGESEEHKRLKEYVANNPHVVGLPKDHPKGETEYLFASGDKADVVFVTKKGYLGVEVKSIISEPADLNRGIFQTVKYQALLRAEQKASEMAPTAKAVLVVEEELPESLETVVDILGLNVFVVPVNK